MTGLPRPREIALCPVVAAHAAVSTSEQLVDDRRTLYRLALTLIGAGHARRPSDEVVDDPAVRFAVGEVLSGRRRGTDLPVPTSRATVDAPGPAVVRDAATVRDLAPALDTVRQECGTTPGLIVEEDARFPHAVADIRAGWEHARALVPALVADLLGHVALIGILDPDRSGAVVSASSRHMPGVVLVRPGDPLDVAESLVHEAAHQRLFDMALTRDMLRADADGRVGFAPSWRRTTWPSEQTLAAFHAYACLAELWRAVADDARPAPHSALPAAAARARELGEWLFARPDLLGADAGRLVCALTGRPLPLGPQTVCPTTGRSYRAGEFTVAPTAEGRCLVGVAHPVPRLFWLDQDAATVLVILQENGEVRAEEILRRYARLRGPGDPFPPVSNALEKLVLSDLAVVVQGVGGRCRTPR